MEKNTKKSIKGRRETKGLGVIKHRLRVLNKHRAQRHNKILFLRSQNLKSCAVCRGKKTPKMSQLVTFYSTVCNTTILPLDGVLLLRVHTPACDCLLSSAASGKQGGKGEGHAVRGHFPLGVGASYGFTGVGSKTCGVTLHLKLRTGGRQVALVDPERFHQLLHVHPGRQLPVPVPDLRKVTGKAHWSGSNTGRLGPKRGLGYFFPHKCLTSFEMSRCFLA